MNSLQKLGIYCFLIFSLLFAIRSNAQKLDEVVSFADQQFGLGNFKLAATEYNRAAFSGAKGQGLIYLKIAKSYFNLNDYPLSITFFDKSYFASSSDSIQSEAILGKAFCYIVQNQHMQALSELLNLKDSLSADQKITASFYEGIIYFGLDDYQRAEASFSRCLEEMDKKAKIVLIEEEFDAIRKWRKRYNPKTAWFLSLFLPGSGQLYAGEAKEAANSMALLGGLAYITVKLSVKYTFFEAAITVLPWFQRYYLGGANKAEKYAEEAFLHERYNSYRNILSRLEDDKIESKQ